MTCIIGLKYKDEYLLMSDSRTSIGPYYYTAEDLLDRKIIRVHDDENSLICHTGSSRNFGIIKEIDGLTTSFNEKYPDFDAYYIRNVMMNKINKVFDEYHLVESKNDVDIPTNLIVAKDDKCFRVTERGSILECGDAVFDGSGSIAALGAYHGSVLEKDPLVRGLIALKAACKYDVYCGFPLQVLSTKTHKFYELNEKETEEIINKERVLDL